MLVALLFTWQPTRETPANIPSAKPTRAVDKPDPRAIKIAKAIHEKSDTPIAYDFLLFRANEIVKFSKRLDLAGDAEFIATAFYIESRYDPTATDGDSLGIAQVRAKYRPLFRSVLEKNGISVPDDPSNPTVQIAEGIGAYWLFKGYARGDRVEAIRRYNGKGPNAQRHKRRVLKAYKRFFKG